MSENNDRVSQLRCGNFRNIFGISFVAQGGVPMAILGRVTAIPAGREFLRPTMIR